MKIIGVNHIGIATKRIPDTQNFFESLLKLSHRGQEDVLDQKTRTIFFSSSHESDQIPRLELLEDLADGEGPIGKFIDKKGGGIHHIALQVDNVQNAIDELLAEGVQMVDRRPRDGAHKTKVAFVHPKSTGGLLVELVEETTT